MLAKLAKEVDDRIIVVIGGPHSSMVGPDVLSCADIDISVKGEGEVTIVDLLLAIDGKKSLIDVQGLIYRKDGKVIENTKRGFIEDLDSLCFPHENAAEVLKDFAKYPPSAFSYIFAARGCPNNCFFLWLPQNMEPQSQTPLDWQYHKRNQEYSKKRAKVGVFCRRYLRCDKKTDKGNIPMQSERSARLSGGGCELHVKLIDEETIGAMKAGGCQAVQVGIESGNNEILRKIRKNITIEEALRACDVVKRHGINLEVFFIVGFPDDTVNTLMDTIDAMNNIRCDTLTYSIFTPYPGTGSFQVCKEKGLVDDSFDVGFIQSSKSS